MISSIRNTIKNYKNIESKLYSNLTRNNTQLNSLKFNAVIKADFHRLIKKDNNINLLSSNRTFQEKEKQKNLISIRSFNYNFKNNVKLSETSSDKKNSSKRNNDFNSLETSDIDLANTKSFENNDDYNNSTSNKKGIIFTKKKQFEKAEITDKENKIIQKDEFNEKPSESIKKIIVLKKRERINYNNNNENISENKNEKDLNDSLKNNNESINSNNNLKKNNSTYSDNNAENKIENQQSEKTNDKEKDFYNSNFNQVSQEDKMNKTSNNENSTFSREKYFNVKKPFFKNKNRAAAYEEKEIGNEFEEYAYPEHNDNIEAENEESDNNLGRSIDSPKVNKHIVLKKRESSNRANDFNYDNNNNVSGSFSNSENEKDEFNNSSRNNYKNSNINYDKNSNYRNSDSSYNNALENKSNFNFENNNNKYESSNNSSSIENNLNTNNNSRNNNNNISNYTFNKNPEINEFNEFNNNSNNNPNYNPNNNYNNRNQWAQRNNRSQPSFKPSLEEADDEVSEAGESPQQKEKRLLNKLTQFIQNFQRWQYNAVFAKYLNIDLDLISYDLIKKFEDELKADKILLRDLALDLAEFYPKLKSFRKFKHGSLKLHPRNMNPRQMFLRKLVNLSSLFDGIIKDDIYVDNFIFFEPLAQFIRDNINLHRKNIEVSKKVLNFNQPENFFPLARKMKRKFIYHMGPTNSGKTSNALERLALAETGIYLAPLRLLAWEVYEKLSAKGAKCTLLTGQDRVFAEKETHFSMTIEKCDFRRKFEVAVIDEIQMIEDYERGSAWTNAVLGVQADEVHLCGDERGFFLLKQLCEKTGDELFYKKYSRFSNLIVEQNVFDYDDLRKGDCIIAFAKTKIMEIKRRVVEAKNGDLNSCAVIYGDLPSETKKDQAKMFNELTFSSSHKGEVKYDYLVASDAIGMGLNLNINRIIFSTCSKERGKRENIEVSLLKQIAGRAGRSSRDGFVTAFREADLQYIRDCLGFSVAKGSVPTDFAAPPHMLTESYEFSESEKKIKKACLFPKISDVLEIANKLNKEFETLDNKKVSLYDVFMQFELHSNSNDLYFIKDLKKALKTSYVLRDTESAIEIQYNFVMAPCKTKEFCVGFLKKWFNEFKNAEGIIRVPQEFHVEKHRYYNRHVKLEEIIELQDKHNCLEVYINLSYKYRDNFIDGYKARMLKAELTNLINVIIKHGHSGELRNSRSVE